MEKQISFLLNIYFCILKKNRCMKGYTLRLLSIFFITLYSIASVMADGQPSLIVTVQQGQLRGVAADSVCAWKGIPYAKAPIGDLRFRAPQPADKWQGIREATKTGNVAPQLRRATNEANKRDEDCLTLNVWSPAADGKKRPVMFWIHGGGFLVGSGASPIYDGANLSKNGDVVVVTINYRLGALGFLYFNDIKGKQTGFDNNLGIRDQVAALQWVHDNIAAFGGDPDMVTIFGESAGAISVLTLLGTPSAHGLFKRAIVESGSPEALWQPQTATALTLRYLKMLNISPDSLSQLKTVNADTLVNVMDRLITMLMHEPTTVKVLDPTIDGSFIPMDLMSAIKAGKAAGIDLLIGTNKDEATLLSIKRIGITPRNSEELQPYLANMTPAARKNLISTYKHYPHRRGVMAMTTDGVFAMPSIELSELQAPYAPTYMYRFDWSSFPLKLVGLSACHGLELPFVFGTTDHGPGRLFTVLSNRKVIHRISHDMQQSWVNFARYGNPNPSGQTTWSTYKKDGRTTMIFDKVSHPSLDPKSEQRIAWTGLSIFK
jgi:para-nitrobenzyl esterase